MAENGEVEADRTGFSMTLPGRWAKIKRVRKLHFQSVFCSPIAPEVLQVEGGSLELVPPAIISVVEAALPALDDAYLAWHSVYDRAAVNELKKLIQDSAYNESFCIWADAAQSRIEVMKLILTTEEVTRLQVSINLLRQLQSHCLGTCLVPHESFRILKKKFVDSGLYYLDQVGDEQYWNISLFEGDARLVAKAAYDEWKKFHKQSILQEEAEYIYSRMTNGIFRRSHQKALRLGKLEEPCPDLSDDENHPWDSPPIPFRAKGEHFHSRTHLRPPALPQFDVLPGLTNMEMD